MPPRMTQFTMTEERYPLLGALDAHCPSCGRPVLAASEHCPACHRPLRLPSAVTSLLTRPPRQQPVERHGPTGLLPGFRVVLQVLPSGACLTLPGQDWVALGRGPAQAEETLVDLDAHSAYQRGVSRRHCALLRRDGRLHVVDLGSSNGTSLNGERLEPHRPYSLADGDKLILGSMHFSVSFFPPERLA